MAGMQIIHLISSVFHMSLVIHWLEVYPYNSIYNSSLQHKHLQY